MNKKALCAISFFLVLSITLFLTLPQGEATLTIQPDSKATRSVKTTPTVKVNRLKDPDRLVPIDAKTELLSPDGTIAYSGYTATGSCIFSGDPCDPNSCSGLTKTMTLKSGARPAMWSGVKSYLSGPFPFSADTQWGDPYADSELVVRKTSPTNWTYWIVTQEMGEDTVLEFGGMVSGLNGGTGVIHTTCETAVCCEGNSESNPDDIDYIKIVITGTP